MTAHLTRVALQGQRNGHARALHSILCFVALGWLLVGCLGHVASRPNDETGDTLPGDGMSGGGDFDQQGGDSSSAGGDHGTPIEPVPTEYGTIDEGTVTTVLTTNLSKRFVEVSAPINGDAVNISFNPIDGAKDYRIYELPTDADITLYESGYFTAQDTTYRCAGKRPALFNLVDDDCALMNTAIGCSFLNGKVFPSDSFERSSADSTLGYVYPNPGPNRLPVYVLGRAKASDKEETLAGDCQSRLTYSTRSKIYTTSEAERDALIAAHARYDGIGFWVPATAGASTRPVYTALPNDVRVYWSDGAEAGQRGTAETAFNVFTVEAEGTLPLERVHLRPYCGAAHDELVAGTSRRDHVLYEGDQVVNVLRYGDLKPNTVLVLEALDALCPDKGTFSPEYRDSSTDETWGHVYPNFMPVENLRAADPNGEVFINAQGASTNQPKAIARAFLRASPAAPAVSDFYVDFGDDDPETFTDAKNCVNGGDPYECETNNYQHYQSQNLDATFYSSFITLIGQVMGELWTTHADIDADVNGLFRLSAKPRAEVRSGSFLHVTGEMDSLSSDRRYPQIIISQAEIPVQRRLKVGSSLVIHPKDYGATWLQVQKCIDHEWDVNSQCPKLPTLPKSMPAPTVLMGELGGLDRVVKYDVYVSTERLYIFLDDKPYSCTKFPARAQDGTMYTPAAGSVSVTWGSTLYHSGADIVGPGGAGFADRPSFTYLRDKMFVHMRRHIDNIGFQNGVEGVPAWDDDLYPCIDE